MSVGPTSEVFEAAKIYGLDPLPHMPYHVYKSNSQAWYLITTGQNGVEAAQKAVGEKFGPFCFWKTIDSLGVIGMDEEETVTSNLNGQGYHMQNSKIEITEGPG
jgi:hypothetical protein